MPLSRSIKRQHPAIRDDIGDLRTQRPLPNSHLSQIDPFLFLNHHGPQIYPPDNHGLPFGPHPHRGFETVTFIVEGSLTHRDTAGHVSAINAGGVQWMTAGRGVEHSELSPEEFKRDGGPLEILQLWVNLPARLKMTEPRYFGLQGEDIPSRAENGVTINDITAIVPPLTDVQMMTLALEEGSRISLDAPRDRNVFFYIVRGKLTIGEETAREFHLIEWNDDGDAITIEAARESLVIFGHATPYREPVVSYGPFVMNTQEQILQAMRDYQAGLFS